MAGGNPTQLPAYVALRYEENGIFDKFESSAAAAAEQTKRRFNQAFGEIDKVAGAAVGRMSSQFGKLDLGLGDFQKQAADIRVYREALREMERAAVNLAKETGDTSTRTKEYIQALGGQRAEAERALKVAEAQVTTYTRLQNALDGAASSSSVLAQAQRAQYAEQARSIAIQVEQEREAARKQSLYSSAYGMDRAPKSARDSASVFEQWSYKAGPDLRDAVQRLREGDAAIDRAAVSGATLESVLGRVATKGQAVRDALNEAAKAAAEAARNQPAAGPARANPTPLNNLIGADALVAGQASIDRAAVSGATLESVMGRLSGKSAAVTSALNEAAASAARLAAEQEKAKLESERFAAAVDRLQAEIDPVYAASQRTASAVKIVQDAFDRGAISADRYKDMMERVKAANHLGTDSFRNVINSQGAFRTAMLQSGQQMQDLAISLYSGQQATVVFAQQLPQLAFALTGLEGNTNKTYDRIGRFATFLSGPWGLAVGLGAGALVSLAMNMLSTGEEADKASKKTYDFSGGLDVLTLSARESANAMEQLANATRSAIEAQGDYLNMQAQVANASVAAIQSRIAARDAEMASLKKEMDTWTVSKQIGLDAGDIWRGARYSQLKKENTADREALTFAQQAAGNASLAQSQRNVANSLDASAAATNKYKEAVGALNAERQRSLQLEKSGDPLALAASNKPYMSQAEYERRLTDITKTRDAELEAAQAAKRTGRKKGGSSEADKAAREAKRLEDFGDSAAESIARINERFDEQPRLIDQAAQATRQLDAIIKDLGDRKPAGFEKLIAEAQAAKGVIQDALTKPFRELTEDAGRRLEIQKLISEGRDDEATAMQEIWRLESQIGTLSADQVDAVKSIITYEQERTRELQRQQALFQAQLDVVDQVKSSITDLFSGRKTDFLGNIKQAFKDLQGKTLFDSVFGDLFADLEKQMRGKSPLGREAQRLADEMSSAGVGLDAFTKALGGATTALGGVGADGAAANDNLPSTPADFREAFDMMFSGRTMGWNGRPNPPGVMSLAGGAGGGEIVVTARKPIDLSGKTAVNLARNISGAIVTPFEEMMAKVFGPKFASMLGGVMKEAMAGFATGGKSGGFLGAIKGLVDQTGVLGGAAGKLSKTLGEGMNGAAMGTQTAGIMKALGVKTSTSGAQIGGAIGSMTGIPGGDIIGSIIGGIVGGALKKTKWARVLLSSGGNTLQSNSGKYQDAVTAAGDDFTKALSDIADQLGGDVGDFGSIALGVRDGKWRVNTSRSSLKKSKGAQDFGEDSQAAMEYALMQAVERGAITGIRESTNRILKAGKDLSDALKDALTWEGAFKQLKQIKDPLGAALDDIDLEFKKLIDLAQQAGASSQEWADLQELFNLKQQQAIKDYTENVLGPLRDLQDELTTGDNGLSLRARRAAQLDTYGALAARVQAGDTSAYSDYATAAKNLLDIERELYGSQKEYFDRLSEVTGLTGTRIAAETNIVSMAQNRDNPFDATGAVRTSIEAQTDVIQSQLTAVNDNLGSVLAAINALAGGGSSAFSIYNPGFTETF